MAPPLPPDLDRVGDHLVAAAERAAAVRRHRIERAGRAVGTVLAVILASAALMPGALAPGDHRVADAGRLLARTPALPVACDQPRPATVPACDASDPVVLGRPHRW
jgi:hypothetical protein